MIRDRYECDQASLMNDVSLASMKHRVQVLHDELGRLWFQYGPYGTQRPFGST